MNRIFKILILTIFFCYIYIYIYIYIFIQKKNNRLHPLKWIEIILKVTNM